MIPTTIRYHLINDNALPLELSKTLRGNNFLLFDSGSDDKDRKLIFATGKNLETLESNTVWKADGTFKACPVLF